MKQRGPRARPTSWQTIVAVVVGTGVAGMPTSALPLSAKDAAYPAEVDQADRGSAEALAVHTVVRLGLEAGSIAS